MQSTKMKKLLYIFLVVSVIFSACEKEEENPTNNNISIQNMVGVWHASSFFLDGLDYTTVAGVGIIEFILKSDMDFQSNIYVVGNVAPPETNDGIWELNGSELEINYETGENIRYNINSFTGNSASLTLLEYTDDGDTIHNTGSCNLVKQ